MVETLKRMLTLVVKPLWRKKMRVEEDNDGHWQRSEVLILSEGKREKPHLIKIRHFDEILLSVLSPEDQSNQIVPGLL